MASLRSQGRSICLRCTIIDFEPISTFGPGLPGKEKYPRGPGFAPERTVFVVRALFERVVKRRSTYVVRAVPIFKKITTPFLQETNKLTSKAYSSKSNRPVEDYQYEGETEAEMVKRKQVKNACTNCQRACKKCDDCRPCTRCLKYGMGEACVDSSRKERKKGTGGSHKKTSSSSHRHHHNNGTSSGSSGRDDVSSSPIIASSRRRGSWHRNGEIYPSSGSPTYYDAFDRPMRATRRKQTVNYREPGERDDFEASSPISRRDRAEGSGADVSDEDSGSETDREASPHQMLMEKHHILFKIVQTKTRLPDNKTSIIELASICSGIMDLETAVGNTTPLDRTMTPHSHPLVLRNTPTPPDTPVNTPKSNQYQMPPLGYSVFPPLPIVKNGVMIHAPKPMNLAHSYIPQKAVSYLMPGGYQYSPQTHLHGNGHYATQVHSPSPVAPPAVALPQIASDSFASDMFASH